MFFNLAVARGGVDAFASQGPLRREVAVVQFVAPERHVRACCHCRCNAMQHSWVHMVRVEDRTDVVDERLSLFIKATAFPCDVGNVGPHSTTMLALIAIFVPYLTGVFFGPASPLLDHP